MIDIPPEVDRINKLLVEHFGLDTSTGKALWRVVWSDDQFEKRLMPTTDEGLTLLYPEVREVPKYRQWIPHKWVLERLVAIPDQQSIELPVIKMSYEPMFPFENNKGDALQPRFEVAKIVIDSIYARQGKKPLKLDHPEGNTTEEIAAKKLQRVNKLVNEIFADETDVSDHLSRQTGVVIDNTNALIKES